MTRYWVFTLTMIVGLLAVCLVSARDTAQAQKKSVKTLQLPLVFQAAGPNAASIQSTVDAFRAELGDPNNGNGGPQPTGRREINWDGAPGTDATTTPVTPFNVFLNTRGAQFTTPGIGLSQAPPSGGAQGGLATLFNNATYENTFKAFSSLRLFTPVGSNVTNVYFFQPGSNGGTMSTVRGFGAVFVDVDQPDGGHKKVSSTLLEFYGRSGQLLFRSFVPASPGDGSFSFFGISFQDSEIASVKITTGNTEPGPDDSDKIDVVMMDDFIYGEPKAFPQ